MYSKIRYNQSGIMLLIPTIVISAVLILIVTTNALISIDQSKTALHEQKTLEAFIAADSCLELALLNLSSDSGYSGESLTIDQASCTISVSGSDDTRTIDISTTLDAPLYVRELQAQVSLSPSFTITSWQEVNN